MKPYEELTQRLRHAATLNSVLGLLSWDQETMMPPKAGAFRAEEMALVGRLAHESHTHPRNGELIAACESDSQLMADETRAANMREIGRDYERATRLPAQLVAEIHETSSRALEAWKEARTDSDFGRLLPWLERQIELHRSKADHYGAPEGGELYDALLQDYEPHASSAALEEIFRPLRDETTALVERVVASGRRPELGVHRHETPIKSQVRFNGWILGQLGFDMEAGRLDVSTHPFSAGVAPQDTRLTTRYREDGFLDALSSTMHEAGHALYEQGLPKDAHYGQPLAEPTSLGIHESQSRLWENHVGRSRAFWSWALPAACERLDPGLARYSQDELYAAVNAVEPNLIRVESDEVTYNLHIMLRFDLERSMIRGDLPARDLPGAWNERIERDLGLTVPDDARGCLQDIHWAMGSFGYFPTYTLGNLYAAQLWEAAVTADPDLEQRISTGRFDGLLGWLRREVHEHGRRFTADELCRRTTGRPLDHRALIEHLGTKVDQVYGG